MIISKYFPKINVILYSQFKCSSQTKKQKCINFPKYQYYMQYSFPKINIIASLFLTFGIVTSHKARSPTEVTSHPDFSLSLHIVGIWNFRDQSKVNQHFLYVHLLNMC